MATFQRASQVYPVGQATFPLPSNPQHSYVNALITLTRESWPGTTDDVILQIAVQRQDDNSNLVVWDVHGGTFLKNGVPVPTQTLQYTRPSWLPLNVDLQLFVNVIQSLRTAISVVAN